MAMDDQKLESYYASWAKESTLKSLRDSSVRASSLLEIIAKNTASDKDAIAKEIKAIDGLDKAVDANTKGQINLARVQEDNVKTAREMRATMLGNIRSLEALSSMDSKSLFGGLSGTASKFASDVELTAPALSRFAGGLAIGLEVFSQIFKRGTELADSWLDLYDAGLPVTGGFAQLTEASNATGLNMQQLSKVLTKNGHVVATMGIDRTIKLGKAFNELTQGGTTLGMNFEQAQETLLSYSEIMRTNGLLGKRSNQELIQGAEAYGKELTNLSQVTGKRREQLDQEIKDQLKKPTTQLLINSLAEPLREAAQRGLAGLNALGGEEAQDLQKMMAGYATMGEAGARQANSALYDAMNQAGALGEFAALQKATIAGDTEAQQEHMVQLQKMMQAYANANNTFTTAEGSMGDSVRAAQQYATSAQSVAQRMASMTPEERAAEVEKQKVALADAASLKKAQQDINSSLNKLNNEFTYLAAKVLVPFANAIDYAITSVNKLIDNFGNTAIGKMLGMSGTTDANGKAIAGPSMSGGEMTMAAVIGSISVALIAKLISKTFRAMGSMGGAIKGLFGGGMGAMKPASPMDAMKSAGGGAGGMLKSVESLGENLGNALRGIGGMIKDTISSIATTLKTVLAEVSQGLGSALTNISKGLGDSFSSISKGLGSALTNISKGLGSALTNISKGIGDGIGSLSKGLGDAFSNLSKGIGDSFSSISKGLGDAFSNLSKGIGDGIGSLSKGLSTALESFSSAIGKSIGSISEGLGKMLANLGTGVGKGLGGLIQGLGMGIAALGPEAPMIALGAGAVGAAITLIGAGIAGATWIMGAALPKFAEGMKSFEDLDGDRLAKTGAGLVKIGEGLALMGGGTVVNAFGSLASSMVNFFTGNDPIKQLMRFGDIADPLAKAGESMAKITDTLHGYADAYTYLVNALNEPISAESLANLAGLTNIITQQSAATSPGLFSSLFGSSTAPTSSPTVTSSTTAAPAAAGASAAHPVVDKKHAEMMTLLSDIKDIMSDIRVLDTNSLRTLRTGFNQTSGSVY